MGSWHQSYEEFIASHRFETPTSQVRLMEAILERKNMKSAIKRVIKNKGAPGVDGMTVRKIERYLKRHWTKIEKALLDGTYTPMPVRRKEISKPGGVRLLGIPTVLDRVIQQAVAQIFNRIWDHTFSEYSFGFRPERSAHGAIRKYREYVQSGLRYVIDIDLAKFFDRVNHDRLMARLATKITDKRVLKLIRSFLNSGVMIGGLEQPTKEGTPREDRFRRFYLISFLTSLIKSLKSVDCALSVTQTTVSSLSEASGQGTE